MKEAHSDTLPQLGDRSLFPELEYAVYLNHAAISPISKPAQDAIQSVSDAYAKKGVGTVMRWIEQREVLRTKLGAMFGASASEIGFVQNTTTGVVDIATCLPWKQGDRILLFDQEFPANVTPWQRAAATFGLELVFASTLETVASGGQNLKPILEQGVALVAASAVQFQTGWAMPLKAIGDMAKAYDAWFFVDAIQGAGAVPIDVGCGIDFMTCGGHKWMMGVEGAGFLYVRQQAALELVPRLAGWLSHENALSFLFEGAGHLSYERPIQQSPIMFEFGAVSALGYAALEASVDLLSALGVDHIFAHISGYLDLLEDGLGTLDLPTTRRQDALSGTLSIPIPNGDELQRVAAALGDKSIAVSTPDGHLRFAPHWPNNVSEVPLILEALDAAKPILHSH